jgi:hypothetical protein
VKGGNDEMKTRYIRYRGRKINMGGRYIKGIYHYRNLHTWEVCRKGDGMEEKHIIILTPNNRELKALHRMVSEQVSVLRQICREEEELLPFFAEQILLDLKVCWNLLSLLEEARATN